MRICVEGQTFFFDVHGQKLVPEGSRMIERPTVILLHGGPGFDHSHYKPQFDVFAEYAQLIYLDQRGQGRSDPAEAKDCTMAQWGADIAAFCRHMEIEKPILLGTSYGGFTALSCAIQYPELIGGLIILASAAHVRRDKIIDRFRDRGGEKAANAAAAFFSDPCNPKNFDQYSANCFPLYGKKGMDADAVARAVMNSEVLMRFFQPNSEYGQFDFRPLLEKITAPVLQLHGELDPIVPVEFAKETAAAFVNSQLEFHEMTGCSHVITEDDWPTVEKHISAFLKQRASEMVYP